MTAAKVDLVASREHYLAHLQPIWDALPVEVRGNRYVPPTIVSSTGDMGLRDAGKDLNRLSLVAGNPDLMRLRARTGIMVEHGCGQSYGAAAGSARHPAHPGGDRRDKARMFLMPNEQSAARDRKRYPSARVEVIGSPRLAQLQGIPRPAPSEKPTVCVSSHWPATTAIEAGSAWAHWYHAFQTLAESGDYHVIGHAHPRVFKALERQFRRMGIEPVARFEDVIQRTHVFCFDNSSSGFEMAGLGCPVVVLDAPWWRTAVNHGGRFWDWADVGPRIILPEALPGAVRAALNKQPWPGSDRILEQIFPPIEDPAMFAASAIVDELARFPVTQTG